MLFWQQALQLYCTVCIHEGCLLQHFEKASNLHKTLLRLFMHDVEAAAALVQSLSAHWLGQLSQAMVSLHSIARTECFLHLHYLLVA